MGRPFALLERFRRSKANCRPRDLDHLYTGFGFLCKEGAKHARYYHPAHPDLFATVTRSSSLPIGYVQTALRLIDTLLAREAQEHEKEHNDAR